MIKHLSLFSTCFLLFLSCARNQHSKAIDACTIASQDSIDFEVLDNNIERLFKVADDDCVLRLLDTLTDRCVRTNDDRYLNTLSAIRNISDGYVSEYFIELGVRLIYNDFKELFDFLYLNRGDKENGLREMFIESISMEMSDYNPSKEGPEKINRFLDTQILRYSLNQDQINYLQTLRNKANASMFD